MNRIPRAVYPHLGNGQTTNVHFATVGDAKEIILDTLVSKHSEGGFPKGDIGFNLFKVLITLRDPPSISEALRVIEESDFGSESTGMAKAYNILKSINPRHNIMTNGVTSPGPEEIRSVARDAITPLIEARLELEADLALVKGAIYALEKEEPEVLFASDIITDHNLTETLGDKAMEKVTEAATILGSIKPYSYNV